MWYTAITNHMITSVYYYEYSLDMLNGGRYLKQSGQLFPQGSVVLVFLCCTKWLTHIMMPYSKNGESYKRQRNKIIGIFFFLFQMTIYSVHQSPSYQRNVVFDGIWGDAAEDFIVLRFWLRIASVPHFIQTSAWSDFVFMAAVLSYIYFMSSWNSQ